MKIKIKDKEPKIAVSLLAYNKMQNYVSLSNDEIGWLGEVDTDGETFIINDVFLVKQEVNGTTCELDSSGIIELYEQRAGNGLSTDNILLWGHSHVNMGVFPSAQDETQFNTLSENNTYFIRVIMNKKGEVNISLVDNSRGLVFEEMSWEFDMCDTSEMIKAEIAEKVTKKTYAYVGYNTGSTHSSYTPAHNVDYYDKNKKKGKPVQTWYGHDTHGSYWNKEDQKWIYPDTEVY